MPGEDHGVVPVLAPGQPGKVRRGGRAQSVNISDKDNFCFSLLILHRAQPKSCAWATEMAAFTAHSN